MKIQIKEMVLESSEPISHFRADLQIYQGPNDLDGSPTYNLYDPVKGQYYKIGWMEKVILEHYKPGMSLDQLSTLVSNYSTLKVTIQEIAEFFYMAKHLKLLAKPLPSEHFIYESKHRKQSLLMWLVYNYLFLRIPLIDPDAFLKRTLPHLSFFFTKTAVALYFLLTVTGLILIFNRFDEFIHTFTYFFSKEGLFIYFIAITLTKIIHEFGHAYAATYYGVRVRSMGIILLLFFPVMYTDVTDSWKLMKRSQRMAISFAGVAIEALVAGLATLGWALSSPGYWQSIFFVVASVSWVLSFFINLNPALRYDGYYILSDFWGIDNMQARAFAITRWQLHKSLLGMDLPPPENGPILQFKTRLMIYSILTWIYRIFLYITIAFFVYVFFIKAVGVLLFLVEILVFILWPLVWEINEVIKLRSHIRFKKSSILISLVLSTFLFWFIAPLPHLQTFPAITIPTSYQIIYVPEQSTLQAIYIQRGDIVTKGQTLFQLNSKPLTYEIAQTESEKEVVQKEIQILSRKDEDRTHLAKKQAQLESIQERLIGLKEKQKHLLIKAEVTGIVYEFDEMLRVGQAVAENQVLAQIADKNKILVIGFAPETKANKIEVGDAATFSLTNPREKYEGVILDISPTRTTDLIYPQLSSVYQGPLPVASFYTGKNQVFLQKSQPYFNIDSHSSQHPESSPNRLPLIETYYTIRMPLTIDNGDALRMGKTGEFSARGKWYSKAMDLLYYWRALFWSESSF